MSIHAVASWDHRYLNRLSAQMLYCVIMKTKVASLVLNFSVVMVLCGTATRTLDSDGGKCRILDNFDSELLVARDINIGDNVTLKCKEKYVERITWSKCDEDGNMLTPNPPCKLVRCPRTGKAITNGRIVGNGTRTGGGLRYDTIRYFCDEGYWYTGTATRSCQRNEMWSGESGTCDEVNCPIYSLKNGKYKEVPPFKYSSTLTAECDEGYVYNGTDKRRCQGDNQWSGQEGTCISTKFILCISRLDKDLYITGHFNQVKEFLCEKGYTFTGTRRRTCLVNSTWSGTDGTCSKTFCTKLQVSIKHGRIGGCEKCEYESTLKVICDKGYQHNGSTLVCNEEGNWNSTIGHCQEVQCTAPVEIPNGHINVSGLSYKSTGEVTCKHGWLSGNDIVHCQDDGTWSKPGSCISHSTVIMVLGILIGLITVVSLIIICILIRKRQNKYKAVRRESACALEEQDLESQIEAKGHIVDRRYDKRIDLDTEYIKLHLIDENDKDAKRVASDHTMPYLGRGEGKEVDLEQLILKAEAGSKIMLVGRAGVGKSTLVQKTIRRWAQGEWGKNYKYVFLLSVRHLAVIENKEMTLRDLLVKYNIYARDEHTYNDFKLDDENQSMLIFIDGLDEFPDLRGKLKDFEQTRLNYGDVATPHGLMVHLLKRRFLSSSTLILTSRPFRGLRQLKPYQGVEVFGLTRSTLMEFIEKNVKDVSLQKREQIKAEFTKNPILQSVSSITFFCMMLCQAFKDKLGHNNTKEDLKTYTRLTTFITQRYMARSPLETKLEQKTNAHIPLLPYNNTRDLAPFSKLAFLGLVERRNNSDIARLVFDENYLSSAGITDEIRKNGESSGLLLCTEYTGEDGEEKILVEFAHLSIQELLAMVYLLTQSDNTLTESFSKMWTSGRFNMAQLYLFGLQFDTNNEHNRAFIEFTCLSNVPGTYEARLTSILMNHLTKDEKIGRYERMRAVQIAYESQCSDLACEVGKAMFTKTGEMSFRDMTLSAVDMNAICFVIQQTNQSNPQKAPTGNIMKLKLVRMKVDDACLGILSSFIAVANFTDVSLDDNTLSYEGLKVLMDAVKKSSSLRNISLESTDVDDDSIYFVADMLKENVSLEKTSLVNNRFHDKGTHLLGAALKTRTKPLQLLLEKDRRKQDIMENELEDIHHIELKWISYFD